MTHTDVSVQTLSPNPLSNINNRGVTIYDVLKLVARITVPLLVGVFTVIIAIHQQNVSQSNRDKDAVLATELRQQDLELARSQREEDRENARRRREEEKEMARLQRDFELKLANEKRLQEYELADRQLNLSESQQAHEREMARQRRINDLVLEEDRYKESILAKYQRDLATLLLNYERVLIETDDTINFVLRMKTREALRRLDPQRRTILIRNIMQAKILDTGCTGETGLLFKANVSGVEFGFGIESDISEFVFAYRCLYIEMGDGRFATFRRVSISNSLSFSLSNFDNSDWSFSELQNINFGKYLTMNEARFSGTAIWEVDFYEVEMNRASFQHNIICFYCRFNRVSLLEARLDHSNFEESSFTDSSMSSSNMTHSSFIRTKFENMILDRVNLSESTLDRCKFITVSMKNCFMFNTTFKHTTFSNVTLMGCTGLTDKQLLFVVELYQVTLPNGTFVPSWQLK